MQYFLQLLIQRFTPEVLGNDPAAGVDEEILGCIRDRVGAKIVSTLSKSVGFPKLETDISCYRRQHIVGSLFYSNFKVRLFSKLFKYYLRSGLSILILTCFVKYVIKQGLENAAGY